MTQEELIIYLDGRIPAGVINKRLVDRQKAWGNIKKLQAIMGTRYDIMAAIAATDVQEELDDLLVDLTLCEFEIQRLFNFPENSNFHRFWETPKCTCPRLDNEDAWGTKYYIINRNCILHGKGKYKK